MYLLQGSDMISAGRGRPEISMNFFMRPSVFSAMQLREGGGGDDGERVDDEHTLPCRVDK